MRIFVGDPEAEVRYEPITVKILVPGRFVRCSVTGEAIALEDLRYWSVERQEAYRDCAAAVEQKARNECPIGRI